MAEAAREFLREGKRSHITVLLRLRARGVQAGKLKVRLYRLTEKGREAAELLAKLFA
jgi:hypothetical protein